MVPSLQAYHHQQQAMSCPPLVRFFFTLEAACAPEADNAGTNTTLASRIDNAIQ